MSRSSKGAYNKKKTLDWYRSKGYTAAYVEILTWVGPGHKIPVKKDLFGADGVAFNEKEFIWWNSTDITHVAAHVRVFRRFKFPPGVKPVVVVWTSRVKEPEVFNAKTYKIRGDRSEEVV